MNMELIQKAIKNLFSDSDPIHLVLKLSGIVLTLIFILLVFKFINFFLGKLLKGKLSEQRSSMVRNIVRYTGFVIALLFVFKRMGIDTSAILGAAGIAGIVLGFAAQTSVASLISGFFLLSEKPFSAGDTIRIGDITGVVLSVDLLSVKLRTFDNLFVRIPNETITKGNLVTITRFPIRRLDLVFFVAYREDLEKIRDLLLKLAADNPFCLDNPAPFFGIDSFGDSGIKILLNLWFEKSQFWNLKNSIIMEIKTCFEKNQIEIPYQKIDVYIMEKDQ